MNGALIREHIRIVRADRGILMILDLFTLSALRKPPEGGINLLAAEKRLVVGRRLFH